jgi:hypothetical protein
VSKAENIPKAKDQRGDFSLPKAENILKIKPVARNHGGSQMA